jgi:hypothetical protein
MNNGCMTTVCNPLCMPSTTTTPIATRVPNHVADRLRYQAERHGLTMSNVVSAYIHRALDLEQRNTVIGAGTTDGDGR